MYVIETDAPCKYCQNQHGYVTSNCTLVVYVDHGTAHWIAKELEGAKVREIQDVPEGIDYHLMMHKDGRPDPNVPRTVSSFKA